MEALNLTEDQRQLFVDLCVAKGEVPIKPEYQRSVREGGPAAHAVLRNILQLDLPKLPVALPAQAQAKASAQSEGAPIEEGGKVDVGSSISGSTTVPEGASSPPGGVSDTGSPRKRLRGQNKNRRDNLRAENAVQDHQFCPHLAGSNLYVCHRQKVAASDDGGRGRTCSFSHDRAQYVGEQRLLSILELYKNVVCPNIEQHGICRYGLNCCVGMSHVNDEGYNIDKKGVVVTREKIEELVQQTANINDVPIDKRIALRKGGYRPANHSRAAKDSTIVKRNPHCNPLLMGDVTECSSDDKGVGAAVIDDSTRDKPSEMQRKLHTIFRTNKLCLAPLTTLGNLPFRRLCVKYGAEVTMSEMIFAQNYVDGQNSESALAKRHPTEKYFGLQLAGGCPQSMGRLCAFAEENMSCDFIDLNAACPLEALHKKMAGSILLARPNHLDRVVKAMRENMTRLPLTVKMRMGHNDDRNAHINISRLEGLGVNGFILHGRTARQRYQKTADWDYVEACRGSCHPNTVLVGNGDVYTYEDYEAHHGKQVDSILIGRGALMKPWIFTEIREKRVWDISASERFDMMKEFVNYGFQHWGTDLKGVETTRRYFLEFCSFLCRYTPAGLLEGSRGQRINLRPPPFVGRSELETRLASPMVKTWIDFSEQLIGPAPEGFNFVPKHKSSSYETPPLRSSL